MPLGTTENGKLWCLKALHPSDPVVDISGLPDQYSGSTTTLNLQSVFTISAAPTATGTWGCDILVNPDGISFGYAKISDSTSNDDAGGLSSARYTEFISPQMAPDGKYMTGINTFLTTMERWRLVYWGCSGYQDGPALANQGTLAACQYGIEPNRFAPFPAFANGVSAAGAAGNACCGFGRDVVQYDATDLPSYERSQQLPNAMFGESKNGFYMPGRLGPNHQVWRSQKDMLNWVASDSKLSQVGSYPNIPFTRPPAGVGGISRNLILPGTKLSGVGGYFPNMTDLCDTQTVCVGHPPHPAVRSTTWQLSTDDNTGKVRGLKEDGMINPQLADNVGAVSFRNLSVSTSISLYFRVGLEIQCLPGSSYAPYLRVAPAYDPQAVEAYYKISRELKDAYPVEYNDLGKLWDVIKTVGRSVLPGIAQGLSMVPGPVGMIARGVAPILGSIMGATQPRDKPPAATVERAQNVVTEKRVNKARARIARPKRGRAGARTRRV